MSGLVTADMLTGLVDGIKSMLPAVLPAIISVLALRKGISFMMGAIRGA